MKKEDIYEEVWDFIVIGAGIAGIHIGSLLSQHGKVLILEKSTQIGGRARVSEKDGFKLDFGPHPIRFGEKSALAKSLKTVNGITPKFIWPTSTLCYRKDATWDVFPASGAKSIMKTHLINKKELLRGFLQLHKAYKKDPVDLRACSVEKWAEKQSWSSEMKNLFFLISASMQVNPFIERSSIGEIYENFMRVAKYGSIAYPKGGWDFIFSSFLNFLKQNEGVLLTSQKVEKISISKEGADGVFTDDGKLIRGKNIISTVPIQNLSSLISVSDLEHFPNSDELQSFLTKAQRQKHTSGIAIDLALNKPVGTQDFIMYEDPPGFGLHVGKLSKEIVPEGKDYWSFFVATEKEDVKDRDKAKKIYNRFREVILTSLPELEDNILFERPLFLEMVDGIEISIYQNSDNRLKPEDFEIPHLYLTGDSIGGEGAGGDIGHTSVRECLKRILS